MVVEVIVAFVLSRIRWNFNATVIKVTQYSRKEGYIIRQSNLSIFVQTQIQKRSLIINETRENALLFVRNVHHNIKILLRFLFGSPYGASKSSKDALSA